MATDKISIAIEQAEKIRSVLSQQSDHVSKAYHQQAQVLDSLLFWHDDNHGRVRLIHHNGTWSMEPGVSLTTGELLDKLDNEPERFSPNVFLRPVLQDSLLPNAAYVGGPAEIAYYAQMKPMYELFEQKMPFITGRLSATLIEPSVGRFLKELPYDMKDFSKRFEDLEQHYLRNYGEPDLDRYFDRWKEKVESLTRSMTGEIGITDPGLKKHSQAITREHVKSIDKLRKKMVNMVRQKEEVQIKRIKKIKNALFPNDRLQEREIAGIYFMNKFGLDLWDQLLERLSTEDPSLFTRHYKINL